jgi:transcriptional regulator GlxA family with amidase domain
MQIAIVLYHGMTALDAIGPYEVLRAIPDSEIRFVSNESGPIVTDSKVLVLGATHSYGETPRPDIILVPGSEADTATAMADSELISWLQQVHPTTTWTCSVCSGALVLAAAGILKGHPATTHWFAQRFLAAWGVQAQPDKRIVRSGKILTAAGVSAGIDLGLWMVGEICGQERAEVTQLTLEYDPRPPYDAGHVSKASETVRKIAEKQMLLRGMNPTDAISIPKVVWREVLGRIRRKQG